MTDSLIRCRRAAPVGRRRARHRVVCAGASWRPPRWRRKIPICAPMWASRTTAGSSASLAADSTYSKDHGLGRADIDEENLSPQHSPVSSVCSSPSTSAATSPSRSKVWAPGPTPAATRPTCGSTSWAGRCCSSPPRGVVRPYLLLGGLGHVVASSPTRRSCPTISTEWARAALGLKICARQPGQPAARRPGAKLAGLRLRSVHRGATKPTTAAQTSSAWLGLSINLGEQRAKLYVADEGGLHPAAHRRSGQGRPCRHAPTADPTAAKDRARLPGRRRAPGKKRQRQGRGRPIDAQRSPPLKAETVTRSTTTKWPPAGGHRRATATRSGSAPTSAPTPPGRPATASRTRNGTPNVPPPAIKSFTLSHRQGHQLQDRARPTTSPRRVIHRVLDSGWCHRSRRTSRSIRLGIQGYIYNRCLVTYNSDFIVVIAGSSGAETYMVTPGGLPLERNLAPRLPAMEAPIADNKTESGRVEEPAHRVPHPVRGVIRGAGRA